MALTAYQNSNSAKDFVKSISQDLTAQIIEGIIECGCFSLVTDEGVDKTMTKAADIYVKYLDKNFNEVVAFFLLVPVLCNATSDNILRIIDESFCGADFLSGKIILLGWDVMVLLSILVSEVVLVPS